MPRWFVVALTLVLYAAAMALVWWGLKTWVPSGLEAVRNLIGHLGILTLFIAAGLVCAYIAYWPRDADGSRRSVLPRRD